MAFKADHMSKFDQLDRFVKQQRSPSTPGAGANTRQRTKQMLALGQAKAEQTQSQMSSSAKGVKRIFAQSDVGSDTEQNSDLQMAAWIQSIEEDYEENRLEEKPKVSPFVGGEEKSAKGVTSFLDFDEGMIEYALGAVADVESRGSGDYSAVGPVVNTGMYKGQKAYGKYQVMEGNIGPWTEKHYGKRLTAKEFLANTEAQDAVLENELLSNWRKHGTIEDTVSVWFTGRPIKKAGNASDGYTTVGEYINKFRKSYVKRFSEDLGEQ
jgi:hypothetical protein